MSLVQNQYLREDIAPLPGSDTSIPLRPEGNIIARFFHRVKSTGETDPETGLPGYRKDECVELLIPGDNKSVVHKRVTDLIKRQYHREYDAFKQGVEYEGEGLPLSKWPLIPIEQIEGLRHLKIYTVEALSGLSDQQCGAAMGLRTLREKAKTWLESAKSAAPIAKLHEENEALKNRLALMETQMADIIAASKAAKNEGDEPKRGPGRPPKLKENE